LIIDYALPYRSTGSIPCKKSDQWQQLGYQIVPKPCVIGLVG
jgi:hypothetical protein